MEENPFLFSISTVSYQYTLEKCPLNSEFSGIFKQKVISFPCAEKCVSVTDRLSAIISFRTIYILKIKL